MRRLLFESMLNNYGAADEKCRISNHVYQQFCHSLADINFLPVLCECHWAVSLNRVPEGRRRFCVTALGPKSRWGPDDGALVVVVSALAILSSHPVAEQHPTEWHNTCNGTGAQARLCNGFLFYWQRRGSASRWLRADVA